MLWLITNRSLVKSGEYFKTIEESIRGGVDVIILREKDLTFHELYSIATKIKKNIEKTDVKLIINSNLDLAKAIKADGFHCSYKDFIKKPIVYQGLTGVSIHSVSEAIEAERLGASYVIASHIFHTKCKENLPPKGIEFITEIKNRINIPVIALGGINVNLVNETLEAGADGIAIMSGIMGNSEPFIQTRKYKSVIFD